MKGGHKEGTRKQKIKKVHYVALLDFRHIQKYKYIPGMFARAISSVENYQAHMKELYTNFQRRSMKQT